MALAGQLPLLPGATVHKALIFTVAIKAMHSQLLHLEAGKYLRNTVADLDSM